MELDFYYRNFKKYNSVQQLLLLFVDVFKCNNDNVIGKHPTHVFFTFRIYYLFFCFFCESKFVKTNLSLRFEQ